MAPSFGVRLNDYGPNRIPVMARLRQQLGLSLKEIKQVAGVVPVVVVTGETLKAAEDIAAAFTLLGADVEVYISATGHEHEILTG